MAVAYLTLRFSEGSAEFPGLLRGAFEVDAEVLGVLLRSFFDVFADTGAGHKDGVGYLRGRFGGVLRHGGIRDALCANRGHISTGHGRVTRFGHHYLHRRVQASTEARGLSGPGCESVVR